jgi:hypothetical protein
MKKIFILLIVISISCQNSQNKKNSKNVVLEKKVDNADKAKKWLIETIEKNLNKDFYNISDFTTKEYAEYKSDATNVDLDVDGGLTENEFVKKWKNKFDVKFARIGNGFLISGQNNGKIKVTSCIALKSDNQNEYIFKTVIRDTDFKVEDKRDIKVLEKRNSFLISDVKEYN